MSTDDLLVRLTADLKPVRRRPRGADLAILAAVAASELAAWLLGGFMRPDFMAAMHHPTLWWKLVSLALLAGVGVVTAVRSFAPDRPAGRGLGWLGAGVVAALLVGLWIDLSIGTSSDMGQRLAWRHGLECVAKMVGLSIPPAMALALMARAGAPTEPQRTALAAAIAAAAWGAFVFAFACPSDDPLYIAVWYLVGCGVVALIGRETLRRLMRW